MAEPWSDRLYLNGFYTLDFTYTDTQIGLVSNSHRPRVYEEESAGLENSIIGGQAEYEVTPDISSLIQGKLFYGSDDEASFKVDWAYVSFDLGEDNRLRAGKFQTPFLQGTELRNIGFSRIWARPLIPVDGASGFNEYLGVEYLKTLYTGDSHWDFQLALGRVDHEQDELEARNIELISARYLYQDFWLRAVLTHGEYAFIDDEGEELFFSGNAFLASIEAELSLLGWVVHGGYSLGDTELTPDSSIFYLSLAFPFGRFTPYVYGSNTQVEVEDMDEAFPMDNEPPLEGDPPPMPEGPPSAGDYEVMSLAVGARWQLTERFGVKFQFENIEKNNPEEAEISATTNNGNSFSILLEGIF